MAILVVTLSACVEEGATSSEPTGMRGASSAAESGCMSAVNRNYGGNVGDIVVISSEFSQARSMVMMRAGGETWKCLVSDSGQVQGLTVVSGGQSGRRPVAAHRSETNPERTPWALPQADRHARITSPPWRGDGRWRRTPSTSR